MTLRIAMRLLTWAGGCPSKLRVDHPLESTTNYSGFSRYQWPNRRDPLKPFDRSWIFKRRGTNMHHHDRRAGVRCWSSASRLSDHSGGSAIAAAPRHGSRTLAHRSRQHCAALASESLAFRCLNLSVLLTVLHRPYSNRRDNALPTDGWLSRHLGIRRGS